MEVSLWSLGSCRLGMQEDLHIDPVGWGWVTAMFTLSYCLFEIPTGALGDRIGPRRVLTRVVVPPDPAREHAGSMVGLMNTAAQVGGLLSSVAYGYIVEQFGSYDAPFVPMAALLFLGALLWFRIDATKDLSIEPSAVAVPVTVG